MPVIQSSVSQALLKKLDAFSASSGRTRSNYIKLVLEDHAKRMPSLKVLKIIDKSWLKKKVDGPAK